MSGIYLDAKASRARLREAEEARRHRAEIVRRPLAGPGSPEHAEGFVEQREVLRPLDEQRTQREVEVGPASDLDVFERAGDVDHAAGRYLETGRVQDLAEVQQVVEEKAHGRLRFNSS